MTNVKRPVRTALSLVPSPQQVERLGAAAGQRATTGAPFAVGLHAGIVIEKVVRRGLEACQDHIGQAFGLASRREMRRLRELVRSLEYRLDAVEDTERRDPVEG